MSDGDRVFPAIMAAICLDLYHAAVERRERVTDLLTRFPGASSLVVEGLRAHADELEASDRFVAYARAYAGEEPAW